MFSENTESVERDGYLSFLIVIHNILHNKNKNIKLGFLRMEKVFNSSIGLS